MPITVAIPAPLRQFAGGQSQIEVDATTAGEALDLLTTTHVALRRHLFNVAEAVLHRLVPGDIDRASRGAL